MAKVFPGLKWQPTGSCSDPRSHRTCRNLPTCRVRPVAPRAWSAWQAGAWPTTRPLTPLDETWERALCVVAHPDDLEFGAAAAVARWTGQGKTVVYCMVTSGEAGIDGMDPDECRQVREEEQRRSAEIVGVDTVEFLGQPDGVLEYGVAAARGDRRVGPPASPRDRHHRQLPRHLGRGEPQPGRPHRHRPGGRRRGARRRQPLDLPRPGRGRRARAVGRRPRRSGRSARPAPATASTPPTPSTPGSPRWRRTAPTSTGWAGSTSTARVPRGSRAPGRPADGRGVRRVVRGLPHGLGRLVTACDSGPASQVPSAGVRTAQGAR